MLNKRGKPEKFGVGTSISRYTDQIKNVNLNITKVENLTKRLLDLINVFRVIESYFVLRTLV